MRYADTDWLDEISRVGFSQNYDLSLRMRTISILPCSHWDTKEQRYLEVHRF